jgi:pyruvate ferredoxin oxidoreductase alpha subunit
MLKQLEGSQGVAQAVALCRPNIVCAYPISPQTHIVEALGRLVRAGKIEDCEYLNVESEFGAMAQAPPVPVPTRRRLPRACSSWLRRFITPRVSVFRS